MQRRGGGAQHRSRYQRTRRSNKTIGFLPGEGELASKFYGGTGRSQKIGVTNVAYLRAQLMASIA
jgi:hypothetical protein